MAVAIVAVTDLFYQVDTRDRFMRSLVDHLSKCKEEMDRDRKKRRANLSERTKR